MLGDRPAKIKLRIRKDHGAGDSLVLAAPRIPAPRGQSEGRGVAAAHTIVTDAGVRPGDVDSTAPLPESWTRATDGMTAKLG